MERPPRKSTKGITGGPRLPNSQGSAARFEGSRQQQEQLGAPQRLAALWLYFCGKANVKLWLNGFHQAGTPVSLSTWRMKPFASGGVNI